MHDALDEILKTQRHQTAAKNLNQKIEKALNPEQQKEKQSQKQQKKREDQIKYFIGSLYIESLNEQSFK
jgi:sortase (surface protein transpeptidase)